MNREELIIKLSNYFSKRDDTGIPIIIKDRRIYLLYLLAVSDPAEEFRNYIFDTWRIKNAYRCR